MSTLCSVGYSDKSAKQAAGSMAKFGCYARAKSSWSVILHGSAFAVFRTRDGRLFSTQAFCPHKGALLANGIVGGSTVICPFHAYKFDLETGKPVGIDCEALQSYQAERSEDGNLQLQRLCVNK
jgi:nitrite reductase/ring-hydroxylating ferredoxin subunit